MFQDLRHAARMLLHAKGWTAVVLVSLALGIGANTALFTAVDSVILRTVPVPDPNSLVRIRWAGQNQVYRSSSDYGFSGKTAAGENVRATVSNSIYQALRAAGQSSGVLTDLAATAPIGSINLTLNGATDQANALLVSGNYFQLMEIPPAAGRLIGPDDDQPSAPPVAVLSYSAWTRRFGSDPKAIGRSVPMNNIPVTIIGVTPEWFTSTQALGSGSSRDITLPLSLDPQFGGNKRLSEPTSWWIQTMGRLKAGVTLEQVQANLNTVFQNTARDGWTSYFASIKPEEQMLERNQNRTAVPHLLVDSGAHGTYDVDTNTTRSAVALAIVVVLVLLIVCANVANLLLSRATTRQKEIAVRLSMGASRPRLIRQLLTESVFLAGLGGLLGILVGYWSKQLLPFGASAPINWRVGMFVASLSLLTGLVFGLMPALRATRVDLASSMKETSRSVTRSRSWLSRGLLVVQVAISLVLLIGAGLFLRTIQNLRSVDVGFNTRNLMLFSVNPRLNGYDATRTGTFYRDTADAVRAVPGVKSVSWSATAFLSGSTSTSSMYIQGRNNPKNGQDMWMMWVMPEFFETLQIPILRGRNMDIRDLQPKSAHVALINDALAKKYFPGEDPVGKRFGDSAEHTDDTEIIGIVGDTKYSSLRDAAPPTVYMTFGAETQRNATFEVRTAGDANAAMTAVREAVKRVDANVPVTRVTTQTEQVENRFSQERLFAMAYSLFGGLALLLAAIGLFGLMSYNVARRTNEIGIRMALGARRADVVSMVLGESLLMVGVGVVIGLGLAFAAGKLITAMSTLLFGLSPWDVTTAAAAIATMVIVAAIAGYLPAYRASRVDPLTALRYE